MENIQVFSPTELSADSFKQLLPIFFEEITIDYQLLKEAFKAKNYDQMSRLVHKMKGSTASYSAALLLNKVKLLQDTIHSKNTDKLHNLLNELEKSIKYSYDYATCHLKIK